MSTASNAATFAPAVQPARRPVRAGMAANLALPLFSQPPASGFDSLGFEIGWDHARHRLTPPADHLHARHPVREGWDAGRAAFGSHTLKPARAVQRWLQLRLQAWTAGLPFEALMVTPHYLAQLDVTQCPVTREVLTHDQGLPSDATVMRLRAAQGFSAGHLVVVSRRVAQARGQADSAAVDAIVRHLRDQPRECDLRGRAEASPAAAGLSLVQWERLAGLLSLAEGSAHERVATRPLRVLPPNRLVLVNAAQALQVLLTQLSLGDGYAQRLKAVAALLPNADARRAFNLFMNALLARRLAAGWACDPLRLRTALEDAWRLPVIERRWEQLILRLKRSECERMVQQAARQGLFGGASRWLGEAVLTQGWSVADQAPASAAATASTEASSLRASSRLPSERNCA